MTEFGHFLKLLMKIACATADPLCMTGYQSLPLYHGTPTDWLNLYTSLKIVQVIKVQVNANKNTIVSLDL